MTPAADKLIADGLWRDIKEAPKDASKIIITDGFCETRVAFWAEKQQQFCAYNCGDDYFSVTFYTNELTHFRHLPDDRLANALKVAVGALNWYSDKVVASGEHAKQALAEIERIAKGE